MENTFRKTVKITLDQHYDIINIKKNNNKKYIYLRYRMGKTEERTSLPSNFYTLSKTAQQKEYKMAKEKLDTKLGLSKNQNKDMRKVEILYHIDKYLEDFYENYVRDNINKQVTFDSTAQIVRHRIERHVFSQCTIDEIVNNDRYLKQYFKESREGFYCKSEKKEIKPISKSSIDKEVQLLINTLKFIKFEKKWISADDYETIMYQIQKYRSVGSYSKKQKNETLSAYEFALFRKEILERCDTDETYFQIFKEELQRRNIGKLEMNYILYLYTLERQRVQKDAPILPIPNIEDIDIKKTIAIYKDAEETVKAYLETGFMKEQPDLHYPLIRYYKQSDGSWSSKENDRIDEYADFYVINRKNKTDTSFPYYYGDGSLNALFLLFNINTGMRFNENRSIKVGSIRYRKIQTSTNESVYTYYLYLDEQVQSVMERDDFGQVIRDEDNRIRRKQIITDPKTSSSIREIPLNNTAITVLRIIQDTTGTKIFNDDNTISKEHAHRYVFVNYKKHENSSGKNMGREGVFYKNFKTYFTYKKLRDEPFSEIDLCYRLREIDNIDETRAYYYQQISNIKKRIDNGEKFNWDKQIYVIKPPALPSNSNINKTLKRILSNMRVENYKNFSVHDLRRTTSSLMSENGHKTLDIQHILGHAENSSITEDVYIKTSYLPALSALQELDEMKVNSSH